MFGHDTKVCGSALLDSRLDFLLAGLLIRRVLSLSHSCIACIIGLSPSAKAVIGALIGLESSAYPSHTYNSTIEFVYFYKLNYE